GELSYRRRSDGPRQKLYRAYQVMLQPPPPVDATDAASYLAKTPPAADPYGWGILQSLGLAAAIRIFDPAADRFLVPSKLAKAVNAAFTGVLARWEERYPQLMGQPFVE